jgi:hypothetical protein
MPRICHDKFETNFKTPFANRQTPLPSKLARSLPLTQFTTGLDWKCINLKVYDGQIQTQEQLAKQGPFKGIEHLLSEQTSVILNRLMNGLLSRTRSLRRDSMLLTDASMRWTNTSTSWNSASWKKSIVLRISQYPQFHLLPLSS